jgi:hypothetical protein
MTTAELIGLIASVVAIIGGIYAAIKWGGGILQRFWHWLTRHQPKIPRETIRISPQIKRNTWNVGAVENKPAMQVNAALYVTNVTDSPVQLLDAYIEKPLTHGHIFGGERGDNLIGVYQIPPRATADVTALFFLLPPPFREHKDFRATIVLIDQYGNKHQAKGVIFKPSHDSQPEPINLDPGEEKVVVPHMKYSFYALSLAAIKPNRVVSEFDHIASSAMVKTEEEAYEKGFAEARERWPAEEGWDIKVRVQKVSLNMRALVYRPP